MTATIEHPADVQLQPVVEETLAELRATLAAQQATLEEQHRMLALLDARREQLDELIDDMMPVANAAMLMATRRLDLLTAPESRARLGAVRREMDRFRHEPPPGLFALARRLRDPDVRRALALTVAALGVAGRAAGSPAP